MAAVQVFRGTFPLMLTLFLGASSFLWPLAPAGKENTKTRMEIEIFFKITQNLVVISQYVFQQTLLNIINDDISLTETPHGFYMYQTTCDHL